MSSQLLFWSVYVKSVAYLAGQIVSLSSCVGSVTRIMSRHSFSVVNSAFSCPKIPFRKLIFGFAMLIPSTVGFIGESYHFWSKLFSPMLPILLVARLSSLTLTWFFIRIGLLRKNFRVPLGESLRPYVWPWSPLQVVCLILRSSGIQTTRTLSLFWATVARNWICRR